MPDPSAETLHPATSFTERVYDGELVARMEWWLHVEERRAHGRPIEPERKESHVAPDF